MYLVKCLEDYGCWGKKGKTYEIRDELAESLSRKGHVKILKYLGKYNQSPYFLKKQIASMKLQIKEIEVKIKLYEGFLKAHGEE